MSQMAKSILRVALIALVPVIGLLIASRLVEGWNWEPRGFVLAYVLFFATGMAYVLIARKIGSWSYKAGVGIALVTGFALGWSTMVQTADSDHPERLWFLSVLAVGLVGAVLTRLNPRGLALTLFSMAAVLALISVMIPPTGAPPDQAQRMVIGHVGNVVLFAASGLLFRHASSTALN